MLFNIRYWIVYQFNYYIRRRIPVYYADELKEFCSGFIPRHRELELILIVKSKGYPIPENDYKSLNRK